MLPTLAASVGALYVALRVYQALAASWKLRHIPTIGPSGVLSSYAGALRYAKEAPRMLQEGYKKYHGNAFKVPTMTHWMIVVSGRERVDELRKATDDVVSFQQAINQIFQFQYTLGPEIAFDPYFVATVRTPLTRSIAIRFHDIQDEIAASFADHMPATEDWSKIQVLPAIMQITCRTSNRLFVGLPICRDPEYRKLNIDFTVQLVEAANIIGLFPELLRPLVAKCLRKVSSSIDQGLKYLGPVLQERLDKDAKYGMDWEGRPNDLISWLLDIAQGPQRDVRNLALAILAVNHAAIHSTSLTFTQVLFDLVQRPEYIPALREEIETVVESEGLTKVSLLKMVKLDSFIKESQRLGGVGALVMGRKLLKDFKFSDGLALPEGTYVSVASAAMHTDETYYADPTTFDGYRFVKMAEKSDEFNKHSMVTLSTDYIVFGHGRHGCPGRFLAVSELKAFMAHLLLNYDIMLDPDAAPFKNLWFNASTTPDPSAGILIRKQQSTS